MVDIWIVFAFVVLLCNYGAIIYKLRNMRRNRRRASSGGNEASLKVDDKIKRVMRTVGLYPLAYFVQWLAYGMVKTAVIPQTFGNIIWVVTTANLGGVFNLCLYGPMLWNQVKAQKMKKMKSAISLGSRSPPTTPRTATSQSGGAMSVSAVSTPQSGAMSETEKSEQAIESVTEQR